MQFIHSIVSTGTQYIDTGFAPNQDTRIVVDMGVVAASEQCALFGSRVSASNGFLVFTYEDNNGYQSDYGSEQKQPVGGTSSGRHVLDKNKNLLYVDGTLVATHTTATFSVGYSAFLLSINAAGSAMTAYPVSAKLYSAQIYDNDVLVRDLWPCIDDNGIVCMYDKVNESYLYNAGTGEFEAGFPPVFFRRRPKVSTVKPVAVTITDGSSEDMAASVTINGTKYTTATSGIEVLAGDVITLTVVGLPYTSSMYGKITIDGETVVNAGGTSNYDWTVPEGITSVTIALSASSYGSGIITVTTT